MSADLAGLPRAVSTEDARQKIDKAWRVVTSLCDGTQDWTMSVPARPDSDPDLVISDALRCARALVSERDALRKENESLVRGLRGKHALTGATYEHLVSERDALAGRVAELEAERDALPLRPEEQRAVLADPGMLVRLIGYHDAQEAAGEAFAEGWGKYHERRALELLAIGRKVIAEDPGIWEPEIIAEFKPRFSERAALSATTPESKP